MNFIIEKFKKYKAQAQTNGLLNRQTLGLALVGIVALSVFWSGAKIIKQNYELTQKVDKIAQENSILELENKNKELQNQYLASDEFADITARRVFGKGAEGEKVYIVPRDVSLSSLTTPNEETIESTDSDSKKPKYQQNLEAWFRLYFGS